MSITYDVDVILFSFEIYKFGRLKAAINFRTVWSWNEIDFQSREI